MGPRWGAAAIVVVAGLLPPLTWQATASAFAVEGSATPNMATQFNVPRIGAAELLGNVFAVVSPLQNAYIPAILQTPGITLMIAVANFLIVSALAAAAWMPGERWSGRVAQATLLAMLLAGPFFVLLVFVTSSSYFAIPARYGLSLLPAAAAVLAWVASQRRIGGVTLVSLGVLSVTLVISALA